MLRCNKQAIFGDWVAALSDKAGGLAGRGTGSSSRRWTLRHPAQ
jgi:hypothetical protein